LFVISKPEETTPKETTVSGERPIDETARRCSQLPPLVPYRSTAGFHSYTNDVARACESCQAVVRAKTADAALKFICLAALLTCWAVQQIAARALRMDAS
jgi:hypothetical protein